MEWNATCDEKGGEWYIYYMLMHLKKNKLYYKL